LSEQAQTSAETGTGGERREGCGTVAPTISTTVRSGVVLGRHKYPGVMRTHKTLTTGERVTYFYHRPSGTRLRAEPGTEDFAVEYQMAAAKRGRGRPRKVKGSETFRAEPTNVYFIRAETTGLIKIGKAAHVARRLSVLHVGSPDKLTLLASVPDPAGLLEKHLHAMFRADRNHGEWFRPSARLIAFIEGRQTI